MKVNSYNSIVKSAAARLVLLSALVVTGVGLIGCDREQAAALVAQLSSTSASSRSSEQAAEIAVKASDRSRIILPRPRG
ncbi:MAG: hypothetical protein U1D55_02625 [Phycisphaerae bacterium]